MISNKTIIFKKMTGGSVSIYLSDVEGGKTPRWFEMTERQPEIGVPMTYALSIFLDGNIANMLRRGYFMITNIEVLQAEAEKEGIIAPMQNQNPALAKVKTQEELIEILKNGKDAEVQTLLASSDKERVFNLAAENSKDLANARVNLIESIVGMSITETED